MLCAAVTTALSVAVRDAVFLGGHDWKAILAVALAILISILPLVLLDAPLAHRMARATPTPAPLLAAAALLLCEWLIGVQARSMATAISSFLHGLPPVKVTETDPSDSRMSARRIATDGGVRVAVSR